MPTVLRIGGFRFVIYPNDHRPPHIHVIGQGHEAVSALGYPSGPVLLRENYGFPRLVLKKIAELVEGHLGELCGAWEGLHGIE